MKLLNNYISSILLILIFISLICSCIFKNTYINLILIFLLFIIIIKIIYDIINAVINYKGSLDIKTPDKFNEPYHPSVVFFEKKWNGYKYWMAYTPFPKKGKKPYRDRWECPCIIASNDGVKWIYTDKMQCIDDLTFEEIKNKDFFSDTHLVYNSKLNRLECYYRLSEGAVNQNAKKYNLYRKYSYNGIIWSARERVYADNEKINISIVSPAIIYKDNFYQMWFVKSPGPYSILKAISEDGISWKITDECVFDSYNKPWHIDCQYINDFYYLLIFDPSNKLSLWKSKDGLKFEFLKDILTINSNIGSINSRGLYRSCIVKNKNNFLIYFTAYNNYRASFGMLEGKSLLDLYNIKLSRKYIFYDILYDLLFRYFYLFYRLIRK